MSATIAKPVLALGLLAATICGGGCASEHDGIAAISKKTVRIISPRQKIRLRVGDSALVTVKARSEWNSSGVIVRRGETYRFSVERNAVWHDAFARIGIDGTASKAYISYMSLFNKAKRVPNAPWFALAATVGKRLGTSFVVGYGTSKEMDASGEIILFANDAHGFYWNNGGQTFVAINRIK